MKAASKLKFRIFRLMFSVFKILILPWKRTQANWSAIIFNEKGQFAVRDGLPHGSVIRSVPFRVSAFRLCALVKSDFSQRAPFRLIHVGDRLREGITFYFCGELSTQGFESSVTYVERASLASFIPHEVEEELNSSNQ
jgi:hypothetical protein